MKKLRTLGIFVAVVLISCSTSKQGKMVQGEGGKTLNGTITARCTPPQKSYAKDMGVKVKSEVDSLGFVPKANFDLAFEQKVKQLREYSAKGLDLDLLTFRICEMANNRGMTSEQTADLIGRAITMWSNNTGFIQNINSYNQSGGITAGVIVVPQDQEIPLKDNFVIMLIPGGKRKTYEMKPRQGYWFTPFIAYPEAEELTVKGSIGNRTGAFMGSSGTDTAFVDGKKVPVKFMTMSQSTISSDNGYYFHCDQEPSVLLFGDFDIKQKQFLVKKKP